MSVKLRLARHGSKKRPYYRLVAASDRARRDGRFIEHIGSYDPLQDPPAVSLNRGRIKYWLGQGAQPTPTVESLLARHLEGEDIAPTTKAAYVPKDAPPEPKAEAAPAPAPEEPAAEEPAAEEAEEPAAEEPAAEEPAADGAAEA